VAHKKRQHSASGQTTFKLTFKKFLELWKETLKDGLMEVIKEVFGDEGKDMKWWVNFLQPEKLEMPNWWVWCLPFSVWCVPFSKRLPSEILLPAEVECIIKLHGAPGKEELDSVELVVKVRTVAHGAVVAKQTHASFSDSFEVTAAKNIVTYSPEGMLVILTEGDFVKIFLEKARNLFNSAKEEIERKAFKYHYNWILSSLRFYEAYGGAKIGDVTYLRIVPASVYDERELRAEAREQGFVAVVRAPYFTLTFKPTYFRNPQTPIEEKMPLGLMFDSKLGISTPYVTPSMMRGLSGVWSRIKGDLPVKTVELSPPLSLLSTLEESVAAIAKAYLKEVEEVKASLGAPDTPIGKKYAILVYSRVFAFIAVLGGLLRSLGYDFNMVQTLDEGLGSFWEPPSQKVWFWVSESRGFHFACRKAFLGKDVVFILRLMLDISVVGEKWKCSTPLIISFYPRDNPAREVKFSLSADETLDVILKRDKAKQQMKNFARQVREFLRRLRGVSD